MTPAGAAVTCAICSSYYVYDCTMLRYRAHYRGRPGNWYIIFLEIVIKIVSSSGWEPTLAVVNGWPTYDFESIRIYQLSVKSKIV